MKKFALLATAAAFAVSPAIAQQSTGQTTTPSTSMQQSQSGSASETMGAATAEQFVQKAAMSDMFEIESSKLAAEKAENAELKEFAQMMVDDHMMASKNLASAAEEANVDVAILDHMSAMQTGSTGTSSGAASSGATSSSSATTTGSTGSTAGGEMTGLDQQHQQMLTELEGLSGAEFDQKYAEMQVQAHEKAVELFQTYSENGDNEELKSFASETLPTLEEHLQQIQEIEQSLAS